MRLVHMIFFIHLQIGGYYIILHSIQVGVGPVGDEAGYNTTQHVLQQRSANYERQENGVEIMQNYRMMR